MSGIAYPRPCPDCADWTPKKGDIVYLAGLYNIESAGHLLVTAARRDGSAVRVKWPNERGRWYPVCGPHGELRAVHRRWREPPWEAIP